MLTRKLLHMTSEDEVLSIFVHVEPCDFVNSLFVLRTFFTQFLRGLR